MKSYFLFCVLTLCALGLSGPKPCLLAEAPAAGALNMLDSQSQNEGLVAVPAKGTVTIDGNLDEWDWSGRMWSFPNIDMRDQYSVEAAAMWDKDYLYLGFKWRDSTPMMNQNDPKFNPGLGWKSDSLQLRIKTDCVQWLTAWYYTGDGSANVAIDRWRDPTNVRGGHDPVYFSGKPGSPDLGSGMQMAFMKADKGYTQEMRIPWTLLYKEKPEIKPGDKLQIGFEYLWGTPTGTDRPILRYSDNLQPGKTERSFFFYARDFWGDVTLSCTGNLPLRMYRPAGNVAGAQGPVKLAFKLPKEAKKFTVVIDDQKGRRVRNLMADCKPEDFATIAGGSDFLTAVYWDGRDDKGALVRPGNYQARGLWHKGLDAIYDTTYYNPGTPPWPWPAEEVGSGDWGANETNPKCVAASGDWVAVGWPFTEGGMSTIGIGPDGLKKWGLVRGAETLAADDQYFYACLKAYAWVGESENGGQDKLYRIGGRDGQYKPFVLDGKERTCPILVSGVLGEKTAPGVAALAAFKGTLAMALENGDLVILDGTSAAVRSRWQTGKKITFLAYSGKGELFATADNQIMVLDAVDKKIQPLKMPGLEKPGAITVDHDGNLLVYDAGRDQQVKAYSANAKLLYTAGKKGGRPVRGTFQPQAMNSVSSIAVDYKGQIWAVECTLYPRRISVWGRDGKLVRDYIGPTDYGSCDSYLDDNDPTLAYWESVEMKLDREHHTNQVTQILWATDGSRTDEPKSFNFDPAKNGVGRKRFRSAAGGLEREFCFLQGAHFVDAPSVLFMKGDTGWRPVTAVGLVASLSGEVYRGRTMVKPADGEFSGLSVWDGFFWNDEDGDGRVQRSECTIVSSKPSKDGTSRPPQWALPLSTGNNSTINPEDLSFLVSGIYRYKPLRFTKDGAPVYGPASIEKIGQGDYDRLFPVVVPKENLIVGLQNEPGGDSIGKGLVGIDSRSGEILWNYPNPYPGVHGSHSAPMPKPGFLIGPFKINGVAKVNDEVGSVFDVRGNYGQDFLFTTDGLYVGALFQDGRYPHDIALAPTEAELQGKALGSASQGGEPLNGWMGRQNDGKIRMVTALARKSALVVELTGLETIKRFKGPELTLTENDLKQIEKTAPSPSGIAGQSEPVSYKIAKVSSPLPVSGSAVNVWDKIQPIRLSKPGFPEKAEVRIAHDDKMLYLRYAVTDASPMMNGGKDFRRLFKTGDAVDLQTGPAAPADRKTPGEGDNRIVFSFFKGRPVAVLMRPVDASAPENLGETFATAAGGVRHFARIEQLGNVNLSAVKTANGYLLVAAVPLEDLQIKPAAGLKLRGDVGFISSDAGGNVDTTRTYWSNQETGLVNDEPTEAWLFPPKWGSLELE